MFGRKKKGPPVVFTPTPSAPLTGAKWAALNLQVALLEATRPKSLLEALQIRVMIAKPIDGDKWISTTWTKVGKVHSHLFILGANHGWGEILNDILRQLEADYAEANHKL